MRGECYRVKVINGLRRYDDDTGGCGGGVQCYAYGDGV